METLQLWNNLNEVPSGANAEGLMVKTMEDVYEPSRRSLNWLKLKDYLDGLGIPSI
jgi:ATP-dependent DNA ligase